MTNFLENCRYQIDGKGKAMVVADSRANAVRYYLAIKQHLKDHPEETKGTDVMIAFSGEITLEDIKELQEYIQEVLPSKPQNYSEKEKMFDCSDF